jgi:NAD+ synthase
MEEFNAKETKLELLKWIREWFEINGKGCNAVLGISGGKDSTVTAALLVEALGKDRVFGVLMPNGVQKDISDSIKVCNLLDIKNITVNIKDAVEAEKANIINALKDIGITELTEQSIINLPPRIRMSTLYAVSQTLNGRVINTCNLSEDWVGYSTRYGDSAGDVSPLANLTVTEVKKLGMELGLPRELVYKTPSDGLCGKSDEDNLGFTYDVLDEYLRTGICEDEKIKEIIDHKHEINKFKLELMPSYKYGEIKAKR